MTDQLLCKDKSDVENSQISIKLFPLLLADTKGADLFTKWILAFLVWDGEKGVNVP